MRRAVVGISDPRRRGGRAGSPRRPSRGGRAAARSSSSSAPAAHPSTGTGHRTRRSRAAVAVGARRRSARLAHAQERAVRRARRARRCAASARGRRAPARRRCDLRPARGPRRRSSRRRWPGLVLIGALGALVERSHEQLAAERLQALGQRAVRVIGPDRLGCCRHTGPLSSPAVSTMIETPVRSSPAMIARSTGAAPRQRGSSDGCTLSIRCSDSSGSLISAPNAHTQIASGAAAAIRCRAGSSLIESGWSSSIPSSRRSPPRAAARAGGHGRAGGPGG